MNMQGTGPLLLVTKWREFTASTWAEASVPSSPIIVDCHPKAVSWSFG